ncbi:hypothetical protein [Streptomyces galbus]|uniref:Uncharacterized protein n=1 Tax=Streptomyces galbus TaxID=33898 RepID=A0A4U5XD45_STRGB|nr:hypothetical protein [Streptomyces galbus]TKT11626.1 hypothetical protein E4U92_00330 [Streptomyces galbus]GHD51669.1 hypothetical protein GCM10010335_63360 [Streptomyces galbus]
MRISAVTLAHEYGAVPPPGLADILWAQAHPADGVEHIRVAAGRGRAVITYFLRAGDDRSAVAAARQVTNRAITQAPSLRGWRTV